MALVAQNQEVEKQIVPPLEVTKQFQKAFPKIEPHWEKTYRGNDQTELNYDADFIVNNIKMTAIYNVFGVFKVLHSEISLAEIPVAASKYLKKNYPENQILDSMKVIDNNNKVTYEIGIKINDQLSDAVFNNKGEFLEIVAK